MSTNPYHYWLEREKYLAWEAKMDERCPNGCPSIQTLPLFDVMGRVRGFECAECGTEWGTNDETEETAQADGDDVS